MAGQRFRLRVILALSAVLLLVGGASVYASFSLTGTGQVTVIQPTVSAVFVSGQVGGKPCLLGAGGSALSCPSAEMQVGANTTLTFSVKNTGSMEVNLNVSVTPVNASVLYVSEASGSPDLLAAGSTGTYTFVLYALTTGNSAFKISVTPAVLPPQAA